MKRAIPILILLAVVIAACSVSARADEVYAVSGALTLVGNNACAGPCTETIDFSFDMDYQNCGTCFSWPYEGNVSNFVDSGSGALGSFTEGIAGPVQFDLSSQGYGYLNAGAPDGEIDLYVPIFSDTAGPPSLLYSLYSCYTTACMTDFTNDEGIFLAASTATPVSTPEPPVWMLLLVGMIGLLGFYSVRKIRIAREKQQEVARDWNKTRGNLPEWRFS